MGKIRGFLEYSRVMPPYRPVPERLKDYMEVATRLPEEALQQQAGRCIDCGIPFCHAMGCPLYNLIPEWNDAVYQGQWRDALQRLEMTNNFPEITGRVCPAPCEAACTLAINDGPVTIRLNELAIIERGFAENAVLPAPSSFKTGRRIAIVGSGPAGLAAAQQLARLGHEVVVWEKSKRPGGLLRYGIPGFKLEKWVLNRRLEQLTAEGVQFETGVHVGEDISAAYLRRSFDAILITCGTEVPRDLAVPGRELAGIHCAMDFLACSNQTVEGDAPSGDGITASDKSVLVIGGGDTGSDCVGTANRQGAREVRQFELLPMPRDWSEPWNPEWPYWPRIVRKSSSHEEGCQLQWSVLTKRFEGNSGRVSKVIAVQVVWKDVNGKQVFEEVPGSEFSFDADLVVLAMGFTGIVHGKLIYELGVQLSASGTIAVDHNYMSSVPGVFAAGDAVTGPSLVVRAIWQGRQAAKSLHEAVMARPVKG
jgi:glutamate synthase (NADPH) small chain